MNTEQLHAVALAVAEDIEETSTIQLLGQFRGSLDNQINAPQEPQYQTQASEALSQLLENLSSAPSNSFPPSWKPLLEELGLSNRLGQDLREQLLEITSRNQITLSTALGEITPIYQQLNETAENLQNIINAFAYFKIGSDELEPGEAEIAIIVPRRAVKSGLASLGEELGEIASILGPFVEIGTGDRPEPQIRLISSSDFSVVLDSLPAWAVGFAVAAERVIEAYKTFLEIRMLRKKMTDSGLPEQPLAGVDEWLNDEMTEKVKEIAEDVVKEHAANEDEGRRNELRTEVEFSLRKLADRIDNNYSFMVRANPPESESSEEEDEGEGGAEIVNEEAKEQYEIIARAGRALRYQKLEGDPILRLSDRASSEPTNGE